MRKIYLLSFTAAMLCFVSAANLFGAEAPYIPPIPDQTVLVGESFTYDVNALNASPAETYQLVEYPAGMLINATSGVITWNPNGSSSGGRVTVRAYNSVGESLRTFFIYLANNVVCNPDLVSYWKLDETNGPTYVDYKGGNTATTTLGLRDTTGKVDVGQVFPPTTRSNVFLNVPDNGAFDFPRAGGFTISMWFNYQGQHTGTTNNQVLAARGYPTGTNVCMILMVDAESNPAAPRVAFSLRPRTSVTPPVQMTHNMVLAEKQWYHVLATYDGTANTMNLYVNGVKATTMSVTFPAADFVGNSTYPMNFGWWNAFSTNTYPFNGAMDEIFIYKRKFSDSEAYEAYQDGQVGMTHCKPDNYFPIIISEPVTSVAQNEEYSYMFEGSDYLGETLTLSAVNIPSFLTFNPATGELSGTPDGGDVGNHTVRLSAADATTTVYQEFTLQVTNVNDGPVITSTPTTTVQEGGAYFYNVEASDADGDVLTYTAPTLPNWLSFNASSHALVGVPQRANVGEHPVRIVVSDGILQATQEFTITVTSTNQKPVVNTTPVASINNYSEYTYTMSATDADGDALTYGSTILPTWLTFDAATHVLSGTPEASHAGTHNVSLFVTDGWDETVQNFTITVLVVNTAPVVLSEPVLNITRGELYTYLLSAVDYQGDALTYTPTVIPSWLTFDVASKVLSGTPGEANVGNHSVIITITDGLFTVNHQFLIVVANWATGVDDRESVSNRVYPNPAGDHVFVEFSGSPDHLEIADMTGKVVLRRTLEPGLDKVRIDLTDFHSGIYFLRVRENGTYSTQKMIIE